MMTTHPWTDLPVAQADRINRLRVDSAGIHQMLWFRDDDGFVGLLVEVHQNTTPVMLRNARISIRDVLIDIRDLPDGGFKALSLRLNDTVKLDIFSSLCHDLIRRVSQVGEGENTFHIVCHRLRMWQSLFSTRTGLLSKSEVQGLYSELHFLSELLESRAVSEETAVTGWVGAEKSPQDFILNEVAVEIKSVGAADREKVRISSEDQLYTHLSRLYLRVYPIIVLDDESRGESLNAIVTRIRHILADERSRIVFENRLDSANYIDIPEYDRPGFAVSSPFTYLVTDGFPRITRNALPSGIESVTYTLMLRDADRFRVSAIEFSENP